MTNALTEDFDINETNVFKFKEGLYGFEDLKCFAFVNQSNHKDNPFRLMISLEKPEISFVVVPPTFVHNNYDIRIDDRELAYLGLKDENDILIVSIVSFPKDKDYITVNLKSPLVLSMSTKQGKQIILDDSSYDIRHKVLIKR